MAETDVNELNRKLDRVLSYIENDESTGRKGLFTECSEMKTGLNGLLEREKIYMTKIGMIGTLFGVIGGFMGALIIGIVKYYLEKNT